MNRTKQLLYLLPIFLIWFGFTPIQAQNSSPNLAKLDVELWPDYDQTAVLVLWTGTVDATTSLPATVTLPLPPGADVHAVARISDDGQMIDDITFEVTEAEVTLTTPDRRFRIEYYLPYEQDGNQHTFTIAWAFPMRIAEVVVGVQQPAAATDFSLNPTAQDTVTGQDGLTYHRLASVPLSANEPLSLSFTYDLPDEQLTVSTLQTGESETTQTTEPATTETPTSSNLPLILAGIGGLIISGTLIWQGLRERTKAQKQPAGRRLPPRPNRPIITKTKPPVAASGVVSFCHQCGREASADDRFCRQCGTAIKGR